MGRKKHHKEGVTILDYQIDETTARRAHDANSFREFKPGRATAGYQSIVAEATEIAEAQKKRVDPMYHEKIDRLLDTYCRKMAANINKGNEIDARVPSMMITGGSNFPTRKKEKQNAARDRNMEDYNYIQGLLDKIRGVGMGGIRSDDPNAIDKIKERVEELMEDQAQMKKANAHYRKHKTMKGFPGVSDGDTETWDAKIKSGYSFHQVPFPSYELTNNNANIKRLKERLQTLQDMQKQGASADIVFDGGRIVDNEEAGRVQILFDDKPDEEARAKLKGRGFKWAPSAKAWQRLRTPEALRVAKQLCGVTG